MDDVFIDDLNNFQCPRQGGPTIGPKSRHSTISISSSICEEDNFTTALEGTTKNQQENENRALMVIRYALKKEQIDTYAEFNRVCNAYVKMYAYTTAVRGIGIIMKKYCHPELKINSRIVYQRLKKYKTFGRNYLTDDEYLRMSVIALNELLCKGLKIYYYSCFLICAVWGLRHSDAIDLGRTDFERMIENGKIVITTKKTKASVILENHPLAQLLLDVWDLRTKIGEREMYNSFNVHYYQTFKLTKGKGIGFHSLRFRFSQQANLIEDHNSLLGIKGKTYKDIPLYQYLIPVKPQNVQLSMGHRNFEQTAHYKHTAEVRDILAMELDKGQREDDFGFLMD